MNALLLVALLGGGGGQPPVCNAGPVQFIECNGQMTTAQLDASASFDPDGGTLQFQWVETCSNSMISDPTSATPTITINMAGFCDQECGQIRVRVTDDEGDTCIGQTAIVVNDTTPPMLTTPPDVLELWTTGYPTQTDPATNPSMGMATAMDLCSGMVTPTYTDVVTPGTPPGGIEQIITRTWSISDCVGTVTGTQVITLVGPSYFAPFTLDFLPNRCPNDVTVHGGRQAFVRAVITGAEGADVLSLDPSSFELARTDGSVATLTPFSVALADVRTAPQSGNCSVAGADGHLDLVLRFTTDELVAAFDLDLEATPQGSEVMLRLVARQLDGSPVEVRDSLMARLP